MVIISFRITTELLAELDELVLKNSFWQYRSQAIKEAIADLINLEKRCELEYENAQKLYLLHAIESYECAIT